MEEVKTSGLELYDFNKTRLLSLLDFIISNKKLSKEHLTVEASRTIGIKKLEAEFVLNFLEDFNYLYNNKGILSIRSSFDKHHLFVLISKYYFNLILNNEWLKKKFFIETEINLNNKRELILKRSTLPINLRSIILNLKEFGFVKNLDGDDIIISNIDFALELLRVTLNNIPNSITQREFDEILLLRKRNGELSELFVLEHEKSKLKSMNLKPIHCSIENVGLGYDLISFDLSGNQIYIEVKALSKNSFFLSSNEIKTSKKLASSYYIYCVKFKQGVPIKIKKIIQNPFHEIFVLNNYSKKESNYKISLKSV